MAGAAAAAAAAAVPWRLHTTWRAPEGTPKGPFGISSVPHMKHMYYHGNIYGAHARTYRERESVNATRQSARHANTLCCNSHRTHMDAWLRKLRAVVSDDLCGTEHASAFIEGNIVSVAVHFADVK